MSQENVEIVRSTFEPFEGVNLAAIDWSAEVIREALGRAYSPDIELTTLAIGIGLDISDSYRGLDGLVEYLRKWLEPFSEYRVENLDYVGAGECVLVPSRQWGVGSGSGARVELELTTLYEVRDGRITRFTNTTRWTRPSKPPGWRSRRCRRRTSRSCGACIPTRGD
jgi:ketosteroid isomerase-like protein